jgi:hypothetical protein
VKLRTEKDKKAGLERQGLTISSHDEVDGGCGGSFAEQSQPGPPFPSTWASVT